MGADRGLGYLLILANGDLNTKLTFAILLVLMFYGFVWFKVLDVLELLCIPWHVSVRRDEVLATAKGS